MTLKVADVLLGLGSVVRLESKNASGLFVVLARGAFRPDTELTEVVPRYLVGPHPYGEAPDHETFPILAAEIKEVVHHGYTDTADTAFLEDLLDQMEHGRRPATPAQQFKESLTALPAATAERAQNEDVSGASGDPFFTLRRLVGGEHRRDKA
jgi:hypothetical protein